MTTFFYLTAAIFGGLGVFIFTKSRLQKLKQSYFKTAVSDLNNAYKQTVSERKESSFEPIKARKVFEKRADRILDHYCNQIYGGLENTPVSEYYALKAIKKNSLGVLPSSKRSITKVNG